MSEIIFSQGSGLNDSLFGKSQDPIKAVITDKAEEFERGSQIKNIFGMETSTRFAEKFTSETALDDFQNVGENGAYPKTGFQEGFSKTIEPATWKSSFEITREMLEDSQYPKVKKKATGFTQSYNRTREKYAASLLAGGVGTSMMFGGVKYDTTPPTARHCLPPIIPAKPRPVMCRAISLKQPMAFRWRPWTKWKRPCRAFATMTGICCR